MKQSSLCIGLCLLLLLMSSCKNLYVQKNVFVPLMKEKGDVRLEGNFGREAFTLNTAYAFDNHFSVMLNGMSAVENGGTYDTKYNRQLETGLGFYTMFRDSFHFESHIGGGQGWFSTDFDRATGDLKAFQLNLLTAFLFPFYTNPLFWYNEMERVNATGTYQTAFFQNTLTVFSKHNSTSFTGRLQYVKFNNYIEEGELNGQKYGYRIYVPKKVFFAPVLTNKFGLNKNVKITTQLGFNIELDPDTKPEVLEWNQMFFSVGLEIGFNTRRKK